MTRSRKLILRWPSTWVFFTASLALVMALALRSCATAMGSPFAVPFCEIDNDYEVLRAHMEAYRCRKA